MAIHVSSLIYIGLPNNEANDWINKYLDSKGLAQESREDIQAILQRAIARQFSSKNAHDYFLLNRYIFGMAAELLDNSRHAESAAMANFYDVDVYGLSSEDFLKYLREGREITDNVIEMLRHLSALNAEDARVQEPITLHNTWYYILGLSFAALEDRPYPLPTLGQARKLTRLINDTWPEVSKRFPEMFIGRKRPDFEADNSTISRQMRSGYKEGLSLHSKKHP